MRFSCRNRSFIFKKIFKRFTVVVLAYFKYLFTVGWTQNFKTNILWNFCSELWRVKKTATAFSAEKKLRNLQSWTKGCRQIDEIKQNRFFYGMFHSWFFAIFLPKKSQNLAFGRTAGYSSSNPSISGTFWRIPNFLRSLGLSRSATREATRTFSFWW